MLCLIKSNGSMPLHTTQKFITKPQSMSMVDSLIQFDIKSKKKLNL